MKHTHFQLGMNSPEHEHRLLAFGVNKTAKEAPPNAEIVKAREDGDLHETLRKNVEHFQKEAQPYLRHDFVDEATKRDMGGKLGKLYETLRASLTKNCKDVTANHRAYEHALREMEDAFSNLEASNPDTPDVTPYNERMRQKWEGVALKEGRLIAMRYDEDKYVLDFPERWKVGLSGAPYDISQSRHRVELSRGDAGASVRIVIPGKEPLDAPVSEGSDGDLVIDLSGVRDLATAGGTERSAGDKTKEAKKEGGANAKPAQPEVAPGKSPEEFRAEGEAQLQLGKDFLKDIESGAFALDEEGANRIEGQVSTMRKIMRDMQDAGADAALGEDGELLSTELINVAAALEATLPKAPEQAPESELASVSNAAEALIREMGIMNRGEDITNIEQQVQQLNNLYEKFVEQSSENNARNRIDTWLGQHGLEGSVTFEDGQYRRQTRVEAPAAAEPAQPEATEEGLTLEQARAQLQELLKEADYAVRSGNPETALDETNRYIEGLRDKDAELHGSLLMLAVDGRTFERPVTGDSYAIALDGDTLVLRKVEAKTDNPELEQAKNRYAMIRGMLDEQAKKVDAGDLTGLEQLRRDAQDAIALRRRDIQERSKEPGVDVTKDELMTELRNQITALENDYLMKYRDLKAPAKPAEKKEAPDKSGDPMATPLEVGGEVENRRKEASSAYYMLYNELAAGRPYEAALQDLNASSKAFEQSLKDNKLDDTKYYEGAAKTMPQKYPQADGSTLTLKLDTATRTFSIESSKHAAPDAKEKSSDALKADTEKALKDMCSLMGLDMDKPPASQKEWDDLLLALHERVESDPTFPKRLLAAFEALNTAANAELKGNPDLQKTDPVRYQELLLIQSTFGQALPAMREAMKRMETGGGTAPDAPSKGIMGALKKAVDKARGKAPESAAEKAANTELPKEEQETMKQQALDMLQGKKPLDMTQKQIDILVGRVQMNLGVSVTVNLSANKFDVTAPTTNMEKLMNHISGFVQFIIATFDKKTDNETLGEKKQGKLDEKAEKEKAFDTQLAALQNSPDGFGFTFTLEKGADGSQKLTLTRDDGKPLSPELLAKLKAAGMEGGVVNKADAVALTKLDAVLKEGIPDKNMTMVDVIKKSPQWVAETQAGITDRQYVFKNGMFVVSKDNGTFELYEKASSGTFEYVKKEGQQFNVEKGVFEPIPSGSGFNKTTRKWEVGLKAPEKAEDVEQKRRDVAAALAEAINKAAHTEVVAISKDSWQATVGSIMGALNPNEGSPGHKLGIWFNGDTLEEGEHAYFDFDNNIDDYDFVGGRLGKQLLEDPIKGARALMKINAESWRYENSAAANTLLVIQSELRTRFPEIEAEAKQEVADKKEKIAANNQPDYSASMPA